MGRRHNNRISRARCGRNLRSAHSNNKHHAPSHTLEKKSTGFAVLYSCIGKKIHSRTVNGHYQQLRSRRISVTMSRRFENSVGSYELEVRPLYPKTGFWVKRARGNISSKSEVSKSFRFGRMGPNGTNRRTDEPTAPFRNTFPYREGCIITC